jgi:hypothetical protein
MAFSAVKPQAPPGENPLPRADHSVVLVGNKIYLFGGVDEKNAIQNDLFTLDTGNHFSIALVYYKDS